MVFVCCINIYGGVMRVICGWVVGFLSGSAILNSKEVRIYDISLC